MELKEITEKEFYERIQEQKQVKFGNCYFSGIKITAGKEQVASFENCRFYDCQFEDFDGSNIMMKGSKFTDCIFRNCNMQNGDFMETGIYDCRFQGCNLDSADFSNASWRHNSFCESNLSRIVLFCAYMDTNYFKECEVHSRPVGLNTCSITMSGATQEECDNHARQVREALERKIGKEITSITESKKVKAR